MSSYHLSQDTKKCIGCNACTIQCKSNKSLPVGPKISQVVPVGPKMVGGLPRAEYIFMPCFHCETPWCVAACPTGAMQKRAADGIVFIDPGICVGLQGLHHRLPVGGPAVEPRDRQGRQVRLLQGPRGRGAEAGLCHGLHHPLPQLRPGGRDRAVQARAARPVGRHARLTGDGRGIAAWRQRNARSSAHGPSSPGGFTPKATCPRRRGSPPRRRSRCWTRSRTASPRRTRSSAWTASRGRPRSRARRAPAGRSPMSSAGCSTARAGKPS